MPPFGRLVRLIARGPEESAVYAYLKEMAEALRRAADPSVRVLGAGPGAHPQDPQPLPLPHPAPVPRSPSAPGPGPHRAAHGPLPHGVELAIDVDPIHML